MAAEQEKSIGKYWQQSTLNDVLARIRAPEAWTLSTGSGVTVIIVDSGVCGTRKEFPPEKRAGELCLCDSQGAWVDNTGHGTMAACIAAAGNVDVGRYKGVAYDAKVFSCRTNLRVLDGLRLLDRVYELLVTGVIPRPAVVNCSLGFASCQEPRKDVFRSDHSLIKVVRNLESIGVLVICAAGNNHLESCGFDPAADEPNTIWGVNSLDEVLTVGAIDWNGENTRGVFSKSSRGGGQLAQRTCKPDCVAPSYGEVLWGAVPMRLQWWGTSGAAPQVAGLAALVLSRTKGSLQPNEIKEVIIKNCRSLGPASKRLGAGIIDCYETLKSL
jgi:serine protease AprX